MKTILLVDPDPFARNVFSRTLRNRGYRVLDCAGPMDARTLATGCDVDLIVADTRLTTGVGNLIRGYRADGFSGPTVVVTSMLEPEDVDVEVTLLLHRPLSPAELAFEIEHLVSPESLELDDGMTEIASIEIEFSVRLSQMLATLHTMVESRDAASLRDLLPNVIEEARQSGLARVAQPLARALAALTDARSRESWQPVADALDDTFVEARAAAATTTDASQFLVCTRDHALHETLAIIAREHLIGLKVATPEHVSPMLAADRYDGLFIDLDLQPPLDVSGFVASLRSRSASRDIPVSFLSSGKRIEHRVEAALAGATRFVEKPLVVSAFLDAAQHMAALVRAGNPSVLVVESDESCAREICQMIAAEDVNAWSSGRVDAIFDLLEQYDPDVLILGTEFQAISGLDVCRILRTSPRWSDLPVLVVTEHSGARMRIAAYQAGADDVLLKPLLREELVARLRVRIERIRLTRERADRDSLTGLLTRRAFLERVSQRMAEAKRHRRPLTICLIDLDHFKAVNDKHGHVAGDQVLAHLGRLMRERFRAEDLRCRWGGEEFAMAFVDEDVDTARRVLQRVLDEFSRHVFGLDDGQPFSVTFSAGLAAFGPDGGRFEELIRRADDRLYEAKAAGRNRIAS